MDMKVAEASGRIGAWASGRIGAWASGQEMDASTLPSGAPNTFSENIPDWQSIHLAEAQKLAPNLGNGVVVAVIDTGLDLAHPVFQGHLTASSTWHDYAAGGDDMDPSDVQTVGNADYGHGTAVADLVLQLAPNAKIMPIRALTADGLGSSVDLAKAVDWAASHGAQVINLSATSDVDNTLGTALNNAAAKGIYITLAAGNGAVNRVAFPARNTIKTDTFSQYSLNAGAVNTNTTLADFSNYGNALEITAPGVSLTSAVPGGYALVSGTSFSTPVLSGALALALGERTRDNMRGRLAQQLDATGTNIDSANSALISAAGSGVLGSGLVNAQAFFQSVK